MALDQPADEAADERSGEHGYLQPLGVAETVRTALALYRSDLGRLWAAVAWVAIPMQALQMVIQLLTLPAGSYIHRGTLMVPTGHGGATVAGSLITPLITDLVQLISIGAIYRLLIGSYVGSPTTLVGSFNFALDRVMSLLWVIVLTVLVTAAGLVLFVIPGVYMYVALFVAVPVLMTEGVRGFGALGRSQQLVAGRWWATLGRIVPVLALLLLAGGVAGLIDGAIGVGITDPLPFLALNAALNAFVSIFALPLTAALTVIVYVDLRVRREGVASPAELLGELT